MPNYNQCNPYYPNNYGQYQNYQYQQNYQPQYQQQLTPTFMSGTNQTQQLSGRTVAKIDDIAVNEVPMDGSTAFFPNTNGQEVYAKKWNADGTVSTFLYKISTENAPTAEVSTAEYYKKMESNFEDIFNQLDDIRSLVTPKNSKRKEVSADD